MTVEHFVPVSIIFQHNLPSRVHELLMIIHILMIFFEHDISKNFFNFRTMISWSAYNPKLTNLLLHHSVRVRTKHCSRFIDRPVSICPASHKTQLQWSSILIFDLRFSTNQSHIGPSKKTFLYCVLDV